MKRLALLSLLGLSACAAGGGIGFALPSLGWYPTQLDDNRLHAQVFAESYRRLTTYYLEPVDLAQTVPPALSALKEIDPAFTPQINQPPAGQDWQDWGTVTLAAIQTSPKLSATPPEEVYELFYAALLQPLDGFSHYIPPVDAQRDEEWRSGYGGIGVTFERKGSSFYIVDVFIGSPAASSGLAAGETVTAINGISTATLSTEDFSSKVRGPLGSSLTLTIKSRTNQLRDVQLTRATIIPTTVAVTMQGDVALMRISRFMPGTVNEFRRAARQITYSHAKAVVLDLQHNPGGILESGTEIAALLVPKGLVSTTQGRHPDAYHAYRSGGADILNGLQLYVLVDGHSASAAEVLAAALQDTGRAKLIGSTTFGKASVQTVGPLPHGGEFAVTWAHLYSPAGRTWVHDGLRPDVCVLAANPCPKADDVSEKALPAALQMVKNQAVAALKPANQP